MKCCYNSSRLYVGPSMSNFILILHGCESRQFLKFWNTMPPYGHIPCTIFTRFSGSGVGRCSLSTFFYTNMNEWMNTMVNSKSVQSITPCGIIYWTSVESNSAKGRIAVLSPLVTANAFLCLAHWAGTFVHGSKQTMCNSLTHRYVKMGRHMSPLKVPPSVGEQHPFQHMIQPPKGNLDRFSHFCTAHPCAQHTDRQTRRQAGRHTDRQTHTHRDHDVTCDICSNRLHLCTACRWHGLESNRQIGPENNPTR